jgi:hypothetical protein
MEMSQGNSLWSHLKQTKMSFFNHRKLEGKTGPVWGWHQWEGEDIRKGCGRVTMVEYYALMNENGKMRTVEIIPGIRGG